MWASGRPICSRSRLPHDRAGPRCLRKVHFSSPLASAAFTIGMAHRAVGDSTWNLVGHAGPFACACAGAAPDTSMERYGDKKKLRQDIIFGSLGHGRLRAGSGGTTSSRTPPFLRGRRCIAKIRLRHAGRFSTTLFLLRAIMPTNFTSSGDGLCIISWIDPTARLTQLGFCRNLSGEFKIDLTPKRVDPRDFHAHIIT
jgi:hypothetical protein